MSVRRTISLVVVLIVLTPFALLALAHLYERWLVSEEQARLGRLGDQLAAASSPSQRAALAAEARAWIRVFDRDGRLAWDSQTRADAQVDSPLTRGVDTLVPGEREVLALGAVEPGPPPSRDTAEVVASGRGVLVRVRREAADASVVVLDTVLRRGIRQLVLVRAELAKLVALQALLALLAAFILARALVRPLEALAARARHFPVQPIADARLLARGDEVGDVARALDALVTSLDARWRDTVTLAGDLTHELKSPLATIAAAQERLAQARELTPEKRAEWTRLIAEAVQRLQASAEALLNEVQAAERARHARRTSTAYRPFLEALLEAYRADPRHVGWSFELSVSEDVGDVAIDVEGWRAALRNLLDNALVQPPRERRVRVEVRREAGRVVTDVIDFGPGVSEGNRDKVFTRFFTHRPEGAPRGTGLGLSIVRAVAQAHGGDVTLQPADAARGACFRLTLA